MKEKAIYTEVVLEVINLLTTDVIATSASSWTGSGDDIDPDGWI